MVVVDDLSLCADDDVSSHSVRNEVILPLSMYSFTTFMWTRESTAYVS